MLEKPFLRLLVFLTCLLPAVSARLPLSDMFNFGIKEYVPYITISAIFLFTMIPIHKKLRDLRIIIFRNLEWSLCWFFPPVFFYMTEGFNKKTITLICYGGLTIVLGIIFQLFKLIFKFTKTSDSRKKLIKIYCIILLALELIMISFPSVFTYAAEGFSTTTIVAMSISCVIFVIIILLIIIRQTNVKTINTLESSIKNSLIGSYFYLFTLVMNILIFSIWGLIIYLTVIFFNTDFDAKFHIPVLVINLIIVLCFSCCEGYGLLLCIIGGIDYYIFFYNLLKVANPVSLLLFWIVLWFILFNIYFAIEGIEGIIKGTDIEEDELEFETDILNYIANRLFIN